jgi:fatty acid desaturase
MMVCTVLIAALLICGNGSFAFQVSHHVDSFAARQIQHSRLSSALAPVEKNQVVSPSLSVSEWHRERRRDMMAKYGDQIAPLEQKASSQAIGVPLLLLTCTSLWALAFISGSLPWQQVVLLAAFPGSMFSLWQLQLLHDVIHGSFFEKGKTTIWGIPRKELQDKVLFWASMPSIFGYYLYLKVGHLSHHKNTGEHSLAEIFESDRDGFEDGDMLFVAHRMNLKGDYGPKVPIPFSEKELKMSISRSGFHFWKNGEAVLNALRFAVSFLYERILLSVNDVFVCLLGKNLFFPNKPQSFHNDCTSYARVATALRVGLCLTAGWKALLFLYLSETLWSLPPHPACAMFVTNHGSAMTETGDCVPTSSTYTGPWYSLFTLGTNYHCEHHDFPTIPFDKLQELRKIAPEFYRTGSEDNLMGVMAKTFAYPDFYACMDANILGNRKEGSQLS